MGTESKSSTAIKLVDKIISQGGVVLFTYSYCNICSKLKLFLKSESIRFYNIDIDEHHLNKLLIRDLIKKTGQKLTAYVFINKIFVGDYKAILRLYHEGSLSDTINEIPIQKFDFDLIVIGGGCGGMAAAKEAAMLGKKVALFDYVRTTHHGPGWKGLGGTTTNVGCIPKKLMYYASLIGDSCEDSKFFGWKFEFHKEQNHDWGEMVTKIQTHIKRLNYGLRAVFAAHKIRYVNAYVTKFINENTIQAKDKGQRIATFTARAFIIAIGGRPYVPDFPGSQYAITSDELFSLTENPGKTLIIGAGFVSLECAGFLSGLGIKVTVLARGLVLGRCDSQISGMIVTHMESLGVKFLYISEQISITDQSEFSSISLQKQMKYKIEIGSKTKTKLSSAHELLYFDTVLVATGREYTGKDMGLEHLGVQFNPQNGKIYVNKYERTSCPTIFAIGDVTDNHPNVAQLAVKAGIMLARRMAYGDDEILDYNFIPITLFTPLEYGFCGCSEQEAIDTYGLPKIEVFQNQYSPLEWALQQRNLESCYVKLICLKPDQKVIGIHILGPNSAEITQGFALTMKLNSKKSDFDNFVGSYATFTEMITHLESSDQRSSYIQSSVSSSAALI